MGALAGVMGALQAAEVIKLVTGAGEPLIGRLLLYDALWADFRAIDAPRRPDCPVCGRAQA
jgi:molybdopterin/thiamine biosynthesis adenylyltransferase